MITVTVVVLTKNPGPIFRRVLASVRNQKTSFPFDVLIIDSGSSDGTLEYLATINDTRVSLKTIPASEYGHGKTRNFAISQTKAEYIAMLTHDACPADEFWLEELVKIAQIDSRIAGVFGRHVAYETANPFTRYELALHFKSFDSSQIYWLQDAARYQTDEGYRQFLHFFSDNNALICRRVWELIPYPDVNFAEDQIWAKTIIEAGWWKGYAENAVVLHSHDYGFWERLQRSFDESYAFLCLFGYRNQGTWFGMLRSWLGLCRRDLRFAVTSANLLKDPLATVRMPVDNFMRVLGGFLGVRGDKLNHKLRDRLSRDRRVAEGLLHASKGEAPL
jgi:rhamnosyltransferase